jgi:hypothetical protein
MLRSQSLKEPTSSHSSLQSRRTWRRWLATLVLAPIVAACGCAADGGETHTGRTSQELTGVEAVDDLLLGQPTPQVVAPPMVEPRVIAQFPEGLSVHGVAGDKRVLFAAVPDGHGPDEHPDHEVREPGVYAFDRQTGAIVGPVPPPPIGWRVPLSLQIESFNTTATGTSGSVLILDAGGHPEQAGLVTTRVFRYSYSYSRQSGFSASWVSTHPLPIPLPPVLSTDLPSGIVYTDGFLQLPDGKVLVNDTILGAIWMSNRSMNIWTLAFLDPTLAGGLCGPFEGIGRAPGGGTRPYFMQVPNNLCPGLHSFTHVVSTDEVCMIRTASAGGIFCIPRSVLVNPLIPAVAKGLLKRTLVPPTVGLSDLTDGLVYDRFHPDSPWVYWARAVSDVVGGSSNVLRRVHIQTGEIQVVASSNLLFDWTSNLAPLPPLDDRRESTIFIAMGQQENNAGVNTALNGVNAFVGPTLLPSVEVPY